VRQAAILFGMAKATMDPKISAALLDKAADLKSQLDEPTIDRSPRAAARDVTERPPQLGPLPPSGAKPERALKQFVDVDGSLLP
jgi:hypothetical protein